MTCECGHVDAVHNARYQGHSDACAWCSCPGFEEAMILTHDYGHLRQPEAREALWRLLNTTLERTFDAMTPYIVKP